jgi:hypothetical protein
MMYFVNIDQLRYQDMTTSLQTYYNIIIIIIISKYY